MPPPKKQPTHLALIKGNPGRRPINKKEPKKVAPKLRVPAHLDPIAKTLWKKLTKQLDDLGVLSDTDLTGLEQCCELYARIRRLRADLRKLGATTYESIKDTGEVLIKAYPQVAQLDAAERNFRSFITEFGLTPSSRTKVEVKDKPAEGDPLEKYGVN